MHVLVINYKDLSQMPANSNIQFLFPEYRDIMRHAYLYTVPQIST